MMNGHLINKTQYDFFAKTMRKDAGQVKSNKSCEWIVDNYRLGHIDNGTWSYTGKDRVSIIKLIKELLNIDLLTDDYKPKQDRVKNALTQSNEKLNALAVSHDFVLVNSFDKLLLNKQQIDIGLFNSLGIYINANKVDSIEHKAIVFVENLAVMANLKQLVFTENTVHLKDALWVYRGDKKHQQSTGAAYDFFRRCANSHQLVCFADFDPAGFQIAMTCGALQLLAPSLDAFDSINVKGTEQTYYAQDNAKKYLDIQITLSDELQALYRGMKDKKRTIQQEHLLSHQIPLSLYEIS